ncbi:hypothetical protein M8C21_009428 [Ambrosia artemisiifolia]|uniref:Uncharacterized protein n=1 Tax=Ambrosia artemisiifolia TaxID=4212 RepID=A0AAD5CFH2_AMBAR|nr:hypothetical protein M8C21_009428 [Ambrosia artemisiifolia]
MSVAFETNSNSGSNTTNRIQLPHAMWICNSTGNPWSTSLPAVKEEDDSSASSSIGNNSDADCSDDDDDHDGEVQSKDNNNNNNGVINGLNDLEKVLPIKRGISTFYAGKSKSYGSLADAVSAPSIQDIVKPEDAYSRKRKNMLAHHVLLDKNRELSCENGISKRLARNSNESASQSRCLPPLPRSSRKVSSNESASRMYMSAPWRSLSLSDLQHASGLSNKGNEVDGC